ncbi:MAG: HAMP domain-containing protein [Candidatus Omnitrophica bacterium]|nr:HAMP domain-containing protein [Candidatus Omnitrophota bacterium]
MKNQKTSLLTQIVLRISIPLAILSTLFICLFLKIQIDSLNQRRGVETQWVVEQIAQTLNHQLQTTGAFNEDALKTKLASLSIRDLLNVNIMDFKNKFFLWDAQAFPWSKDDTLDSVQSLQLRTQGKRFYGKADRRHEWLVFYLPLENKERGGILIARVLFSLNNIHGALKDSRNILIGIILLIVGAGLLIGKTLSNLIIRPLRILREAAEEITQGHLGSHIQIDTGNEFESLAEIFNHMSDRLRAMRTQAKDSNPLTGLPGNMGIFEELQRRIHERQKFVFFHVDLNRFKVFNDHYGLAEGDKAIKMTAEVLKRAAKEKGSKDTFVGHQGGDDYVIITHPSHGKEVGEFICTAFDQEIVPALYPKSDLERGYVEKIDRRQFAETGEEKIVKFPLTSIAVAGVTNTKNDFADYYDCMEKAVKAKTLAKQTIESSYLIQE